jgi:glycosyltransferase involved in cell wall biosynthesis
LANHLANDPRIAKVSVVTVAPSDVDVYQLHSRIVRMSLHSRSPLPETNNPISKAYFNFFRIRELKRIASELAPDVVVSFCDRNNALVLLALGNRYPVLISERSDPRFQKMPRMWETIRGLVYPRAKVCVAQTNDVLDYLKQEYYPRDSRTTFLTIPSAIDVPNTALNVSEHHVSEDQRSKKQNRLLFVGRLASEKQIDQILVAWKKTHALLPAWKLRIVGQGPMEETLKRLAADLFLNQSVEWCGWQSDIWSEYRAARAFVMASRYEGFPQSLVEAMTMGLPCLVTNFSPAIRECVEHQESGFVLQSLSELPDYLKQLDKDPELEQRLSNRARAMSRRYQWINVAGQWESAISAALDKNLPKPTQPFS